MHSIKVKVGFDSQDLKIEDDGINLISGDYNSTKFVFEFDRNDGRKVLEMKNPSNQTVMVSEIHDNEVVIGAIDEDNKPCSVLNEGGIYLIEISLYEGDSKLTSAYGEIYINSQKVDCEDVEIPTPSIIDQINSDLIKINNMLNSMVYAQFGVDLDDGEAYVLVPDGYDDLEFDINESGEMEMVIYE